MSKLSIGLIVVIIALGGIVVWQRQQINSLEEQQTLTKLQAENPPSPADGLRGTSTPTSPPVENTPSAPETKPTEETTPPVVPSTESVPLSLGKTRPLSEAKATMDAAVLSTLSAGEEMVGDVVAVDSTDDKSFYFTTHGKDAEGREFSRLYKYNGTSNKMAMFYWERHSDRFWIVGTDATSVVWVRVPSEPTTDPCWNKWLQPMEAVDVKNPTSGSTTFTAPVTITDAANKEYKECRLVHP